MRQQYYQREGNDVYNAVGFSSAVEQTLAVFSDIKWAYAVVDEVCSTKCSFVVREHNRFFKS